ncbi:hypothetical protein PHLGIDRAFT_315057 [Phlebiopsis gigantea 11061_1 CR5-6]|uniref:Uncharacterized protein n=1 Tax=Phlebiopsis gigantea (strain 11061_1 CR5-6) TaxID=745531 RepID=A0A0C3RZR2_PHLG1|nr:hypothetical protein PHLGIDRAFT_315057 [Phlebiopsis gigantea 11061_1 CR5-6]
MRTRSSYAAFARPGSSVPTQIRTGHARCQYARCASEAAAPSRGPPGWPAARVSLQQRVDGCDARRSTLRLPAADTRTYASPACLVCARRGLCHAASPRATFCLYRRACRHRAQRAGFAPSPGEQGADRCALQTISASLWAGCWAGWSRARRRGVCMRCGGHTWAATFNHGRAAAALADPRTPSINRSTERALISARPGGRRA